MDRFIVISGCSGGGKSSLLRELKARQFATIEEPGRRIVEQASTEEDPRLPWNNLTAFAERALELALEDHRKARHRKGFVFFDRGIVDAAVALVASTGSRHASSILNKRYYNESVFITPPWPEIYVQDDERRHSFDDAVAEYERLVSAYRAAGYVLHHLPKVSTADRADFVIERLCHQERRA